MKTKLLILSLLCISLAACGLRRREQPTQPALPAPAVATSLPTHTPAQPTVSQPINTSQAAQQATVAPTDTSAATQVPEATKAPTDVPTLAPTATSAPQNDSQGDQLENQLDQLTTQNAADDQMINGLPNP